MAIGKTTDLQPPAITGPVFHGVGNNLLKYPARNAQELQRHGIRKDLLNMAQCKVGTRREVLIES
jgi:hypothetical protein